MRKSVLSLVLLTIVCLLHAVPAQAQTRVFVAAQGSDSNPCTFALPCRTFQHAHDVVAANGEIDVLDPAGYGALTITKGISIQGHGFSGITATSGTAIRIAAGPNDTISLRWLIIEGLGTGSGGITVNSAGSVDIANCVVRNFVNNGIWIAPIASITFSISDTTTSGNGFGGIVVQPGLAPTVNGDISNVKSLHNQYGINVFAGGMSGGSINAAIANSVISNNVTGISFATNTATTLGVVQDSLLANNANGLTANNLATVYASRLTVFNSTTAFGTTNSGSIADLGNNITVPLVAGGPAVPLVVGGPLTNR